MTLPQARGGGHREHWSRVSRCRPCPICEKPDWCLYAGPDDSPTAAICARIESPKRCGEAGWLHRLRNDDWRRSLRRSYCIAPRRLTSPAPHDWQQLVKHGEASLTADRLDSLALELGISSIALTRLRLGWSDGYRAFMFPMLNANYAIRGVRLRGASGHKWSIRGGREGLFVPCELPSEPLLLVCEGPTDTAALVELGFTVVGRPSCSGGLKLAVDFVRRHRPEEVAIIADADPPGVRGAENLSSVLAAYVMRVRVLTPPPGVKDARDWKRRGATRGDVLRRIGSVAPRRLGIVVKGDKP